MLRCSADEFLEMPNPNPKLRALQRHVTALHACTACPKMIRPVVSGPAILSPVMLIGQAPGDKEGIMGRPFAWTAGKTLFKWFQSIGLSEEQFRALVYMAAVCRCFPGKNPKGGDRVPEEQEIRNCSQWMTREFELLQPELIIPVGKLAISQLMPVVTLNTVIGNRHRISVAGREVDCIPLPHPSGASTWHRMEPGKTLLEKSLRLIAKHPGYRGLLDK